VRAHLRGGGLRSVCRPVLEECLAELAAGDILVVWRLDRLGRSAQHLLGILEQLRERGVAFRSVTEGVDTSTYMGRFVFTERYSELA
jgi:DNA invertase Pin-like site-specific DNA recombinase